MTAFNPKDYYFKKAKADQYAARSAFKLEEIQKKFKILKPSHRVLDLGCSPGSWSQFAAKTVEYVLGIDIQPTKLTVPKVEFKQQDIHDFETDEKFDVILSDMAPKTTGVKVTDQTRSLELCQMALNVARKNLKKGGSFVCKLFHSEDFEDFRKDFRQNFSRVELLKPKSTRKQSKEIFFVGIDFKPH